MNKRFITILSVFILSILLSCNSIHGVLTETYTSSFDISVQCAGAQGITTDGTYVWIVDYADDEVYRYAVSGTYVDSFDTSVQCGDARGLTTDGSSIWMVDIIDDEVYRYNTAGAFQDQFDTSVQSTDPSGITNNGTHLFVYDYIDDEVYMYTSAGVYVSSFDTSGESTDGNGIACDGDSLWVVDITSDEVYQYTLSGTYVYTWDISGETGDGRGITVYASDYYDKNFYIVADIGDEVYTYDGIPAYSELDWVIYSDKYDFAWHHGACNDYTMIRKNQGDYPDNNTDGSLVGNVTGITRTITDYSLNEELYYSIWVWNSSINIWSAQHNFTYLDFAFLNITEEEYYADEITFEGYISGTTAYVNYSDGLSETENTNITVYEINGSTGNFTLCYYNTTVNVQSFQRTFTINTSNNYEVILYLNHSTFGTVYDYFILIGSARNITSTSRFNVIFDVLGDNPFGWSGFGGFIVLIFCMFSFGARNAGVALVLSGGIMLFLTFIVGSTFLSGSIAIILIALGILTQWTSGG